MTSKIHKVNEIPCLLVSIIPRLLDQLFDSVPQAARLANILANIGRVPQHNCRL